MVKPRDSQRGGRRRGAGRPATGRVRYHRVTVRLDDAEHEELADEARAEGVTTAVILRRAAGLQRDRVPHELGDLRVCWRHRGWTSHELPPDLLDALRARAAVEGCSASDLMRRALRLYLRSSEAIDRYAAELVASSPELQALDRRWAEEDARSPEVAGMSPEVAANPLDRAAGVRVQR